MNRLVDVDVNNVHLVGAPANRRPFAIIKGLTTSRGDPKPKESGTVKIVDLLKAVGLKPEGVLEKVDTDVTPEQFKALVKALGKDNGEKLIEALGKEEVAKILGVDLPKKKEPTIDKSGLTPEVKAYVEKMEAQQKELKTTLDEIVKDRSETEKAALEARVEILKEHGFGPDDGDETTPTEVEVTAMEKAAEKFLELRKALGIFKVQGTDEGKPGSARDEVRKAVRSNLGREPKDATEEAKARREIYRANPGLLRAITREEREDRAS